MVKTAKTLADRDATLASARVTKTAKPVGRPPANGAAPRRISLAPAQLRAWLGTVEQALASPRAASTAERLGALQTDMVRRLGPHADPSYRAGKTGDAGAKRPEYRVTRADGTDATFQSLAKAAKEYGAKPASLRVMLSRGGGKCRKPEYHDGAESEVTCEKLAR